MYSELHTYIIICIYVYHIYICISVYVHVSRTSLCSPIYHTHTGAHGTSGAGAQNRARVAGTSSHWRGAARRVIAARNGRSGTCNRGHSRRATCILHYNRLGLSHGTLRSKDACTTNLHGWMEGDTTCVSLGRTTRICLHLQRD